MTIPQVFAALYLAAMVAGAAFEYLQYKARERDRDDDV